MNPKKSNPAGLGLVYTISLNERAYNKVKSVQEQESLRHRTHSPLGVIASTLILWGEECYNSDAQCCAAKPPSESELALSRATGLLKQLEEIVQKEKEKHNEQN